MKKFRSAPAAAVLAGAMAISGAAAAATIYTFDVTDGTAVITVNANSYTVVLTDTTTDASTNQEISGLQITFATPLGSPTLASQSGSLIDIAKVKKNIVVTPVSGNPDWTLTGTNLSALSDTPKDDLIIGPGPYTSAASHDPQIDQTGTFVVDFTGKAPAITGVNFGFGVGNTFLPGTLVSVVGGVPEPATWAMLLIGIGAVGAGLRMRRRMTPVTA